MGDLLLERNEGLTFSVGCSGERASWPHFGDSICSLQIRGREKLNECGCLQKHINVSQGMIPGNSVTVGVKFR